ARVARYSYNFIMNASPDHACICCKRAMLALPMARDIDPARNPHVAAWGEVIEKTNESPCPAWASNQPAMQPNRHHLGRAFALAIEHVEGVLEICKQLIPGAETLRVDETHIVGIERVRNDEMRCLRSLDPIGQIVGVGIR